MTGVDFWVAWTIGFGSAMWAVVLLRAVSWRPRPAGTAHTTVARHVAELYEGERR